MVTPILKSKSLRFPAEWEPQSGVLLVWPPKKSYWTPLLAETENTYAQLISAIAENERVLLVCEDVPYAKNFLNPFKMNVQNVVFVELQTNDVWARDFGPITVFENDAPKLLDFCFNAWGGKYSLPLDDQATRALKNKNLFGDTPLERIEFILEGGSIDTNGQGVLLTTARCLTNTNRHEHTDLKTLEQVLKTSLGVTHIHWLQNGYLCGDDTDAHIDTLVRFCESNMLCYQSCEDPADEHYEELQKMAHELAAFKNEKGLPYARIPLPWPQKKLSRLDGNRLPASYANFLITNTQVLCPTYDDPADGEALEILAQCFPKRRVLGIDSLALIENFGSIHCLSMQLPLGVLP